MRAAPRFRFVVLVLGVLATLLAGQVSMPARGGGFGGSTKGQKEGGDVPEPVRTVHMYREMTPRAAKTWLKLQEPISASFPNETLLEDFLKDLKEATRGKDKKEPAIPIFVDPVGLNEAEKTMTSPITVDLEDVPAATVLELVLKQLGLRHYVQKDGIVMITSIDPEDPDDLATPADSTALMLNTLSTLQAEVAALRREVAALGNGK